MSAENYPLDNIKTTDRVRKGAVFACPRCQAVPQYDANTGAVQCACGLAAPTADVWNVVAYGGPKVRLYRLRVEGAKGFVEVMTVGEVRFMLPDETLLPDWIRVGLGDNGITLGDGCITVYEPKGPDATIANDDNHVLARGADGVARLLLADTFANLFERDYESEIEYVARQFQTAATELRDVFAKDLSFVMDEAAPLSAATMDRLAKAAGIKKEKKP